jgi:hypothetical protein
MSDHVFHRGFLDLLLKFVSKYPESEQSDELMSRVANMSVMRYIFSSLYGGLIFKKELKTLEDMPIEHKREIWEMAEKYCEADLSKEQRIEFCKAAMAVNWLLSN